MHKATARALRRFFIASIIVTLGIGSLPNTEHASAFVGGDGTADDPYQISTCQDLQDMANDLDASYTLVNLINCTGFTYTSVGNNTTPFTGTFDGQNYTISNLTITSAGLYVGVFGYTDGATIENVFIEDGSFSGQAEVGALVGYAGFTSISYITTTNTTVNATNDVVGGIVGGLGGSSLEFSSVQDTEVSGGGQQIGGLVGWVVGPSSLSNSYAHGSIIGDTNVGGVAGQAGPGPSIVSRTYADVTFDGLAGSDLVGLTDITAFPSENFMASAPYLSNNTQSPLDSWDFDTVWYVRDGNYPALRPNFEISMLCYPPSPTDTSISGSCTTYPADLQTSLTWEIMYKPDLKTEWISRPNQVTDIFSDTITGLVPGTDYTIRFRHSSILGTSEWGAMNLTTTGPSDSDGDNVSNLDESYAPNNGDANDDGTPDYTQAKVTSVLNDTTEKYVSLATTCNDNFNVMIGMESSGDQADNYFDYPAGLIGFVGRSCGVGATVDVNLYFYDVTAKDLVLRKKVNDTYMTVGATVNETTVDSSTVTHASYQITDGGSLDDDGIADGNIVDPIGLANVVIGIPDTGFNR